MQTSPLVPHAPRRPVVALLLLCGAAAAVPASAAAQIRSVVVPADAAVVVPPRGVPAPRLAMRSTEVRRQRAQAAVPLAAPRPRGLSPAVGGVLPLLAGALLGIGLPGDGGGGGPVATNRTR